MSTITEKKENELRETIRKFEALVSEGIPKAEAARRLGYADYPTIWKKYQELKRLETEKKTKQGINQSTYKESLKVNTRGTYNAPAVAGEEVAIEVVTGAEAEIVH